MRHYKGNYSKYLDLKAEQLASEWKAYEKQQTEIHKLEDCSEPCSRLYHKTSAKPQKDIRKWTGWIVLKG